MLGANYASTRTSLALATDSLLVYAANEPPSFIVGLDLPRRATSACETLRKTRCLPRPATLKAQVGRLCAHFQLKFQAGCVARNSPQKTVRKNLGRKFCKPHGTPLRG